jgi:hypothetical protein
LDTYDSKCAGTKLAERDMIDEFYLLLLLLRGTSILYYEEEIGCFFLFQNSLVLKTIPSFFLTFSEYIPRKILEFSLNQFSDEI